MLYSSRIYDYSVKEKEKSGFTICQGHTFVEDCDGVSSSLAHLSIKATFIRRIEDKWKMRKAELVRRER